jgi:hypothetical protein
MVKEKKLIHQEDTMSTDTTRTATANTLALRSFDEDGPFLTIKITSPEPDLALAVTEKVRELVAGIKEVETTSDTASALGGLRLGDHEVLTRYGQDATREFTAMARSVEERVWH